MRRSLAGRTNGRSSLSRWQRSACCCCCCSRSPGCGWFRCLPRMRHGPASRPCSCLCGEMSGPPGSARVTGNGKTGEAVFGGVAADVAGVHGCRHKSCVDVLGLLAFLTLFRGAHGVCGMGLLFPARQVSLESTWTWLLVPKRTRAESSMTEGCARDGGLVLGRR